MIDYSVTLCFSCSHQAGFSPKYKESKHEEAVCSQLTVEQSPSDGGDKHSRLDCPLGVHCTCTRPIEKMLKNDSSVGGKVFFSPSEAVLLAGG